MKKSWFAAFLFAFALLAHSQTAPESSRHNIQQLLSFEGQGHGAAPTGWFGAPTGSILADNNVVHSGKWAARLERTATTAEAFSTITASVPFDFIGSSIEFRGFLRLKDVSGFAGLWVREDGESGETLQFDNMQSSNLSGTHDWTEYSIKLPVDSAARKLFFGALIVGSGTLWADDFQLLVDGQPIANAPDAPPPPQTVLGTDHEFDTTSRIHIDSLTPVQIDNLTTLARVWGFLKYHHPAVTAGKRQWDYDLFRILPAVLAAQNRQSANDALLQWIDALGPVPECRIGRPLLTGDLDLKPDISWIHDGSLLGPVLRNRLEILYSECPGPKTQFYVSLMPMVDNARFDHELIYSGVQFPDSGFQLLALFRWWNIIQYWSPYRLAAQQDWSAILAEFIPRVALAKDKDSYSLAMLALIAKANDTHANLWSSLRVRPPVGSCWLRVQVRFLNGQPAVIDLLPDAKSPVPLHIGDVIESLDNVPVSKLVADWTPFYADSNAAARERDMGFSFTRGPCGPSSVTVRRDGESISLSATREELPPNQKINAFHDRPGDTFQLLSPDIAYLKLSTIKATDVAGYIEKAKNTRGLIVDIRNYPSAFMPFTLGPALVTTPTQFASFTKPDLDNPGAFHFTLGDPISPGPLHYKGKVVILVDEVSVSQSEYTAMALRSAPGAIIVGSTTAGADGNVSSIPLPGGLGTAISGIGVFYPDRRPTQRIGILPDVEARPTLAGIVAGRDEVLETAIRQILGPSIPEEQIEHMAQPSH